MFIFNNSIYFFIVQYIQLQLIAGVFERHRLSITENCVNLDSSEIEDVLSDIYFAACKENNTNFDVDFVTKLALNYILTIYDKYKYIIT